ncbi:MAG: hypothetical protein M0R22_00945 [Dehalococcoidia bacterium]|jgi:hypothetical protein|nr:hypothetical protein [Dehalococcoidia bacterium]
MTPQQVWEAMREHCFWKLAYVVPGDPDPDVCPKERGIRCVSMDTCPLLKEART